LSSTHQIYIYPAHAVPGLKAGRGIPFPIPGYVVSDVLGAACCARSEEGCSAGTAGEGAAALP